MDSKYSNLSQIINSIHEANTILLSTHRQCDGDGLGAQLGVFHALKKMGKTVRILNVDETPSKYNFLDTQQFVQAFDGPHDELTKIDLVLIFDTNDQRLLEPLYSQLEQVAQQIIFIDHHPLLESGPQPTEGSYIDIKAASTGEIAFSIIEQLPIELDFQIARAIYTSIVFDTQLFRYVRNSATSHLISAKLLEYETEPFEVHKNLFAQLSINKVRFLSHSLEKTQFFQDGQIALLNISFESQKKFHMSPEDSRDVIDFLMNIDTLIIGAMVRENEDGTYKISLRSKGPLEVRTIAEELGGGGHAFASGATTPFSDKIIEERIIDHFTNNPFFSSK